MANMLIQIPANDKAKYAIYLSLLNNFIGIYEDDVLKTDPLTPRELELLGLLCYYNQIYLQLPEQARYRYLHSTDIRNQIKDELNIDTNNYNNILGRLSKKVLKINKDPLYDNGKINQFLAIDITNYDGIEFKFKSIN